jgi:carbon monoxide dehydrogenase subunit G
MYIEKSIVIERKPEVVWKFLGSVENVAMWDRGVGRTETTYEPSESSVGLEFDTFMNASGSDKGKMSYRITDVGKASCTVELTSTTGNARFFKRASWTFKTEPDRDGTLLVCAADFAVRLRFLFLAPLLYLKRSAISIDLNCLKLAIEAIPD